MGWLSKKWKQAKETGFGKDVRKAYKDTKEEVETLFHKKEEKACADIHKAAKDGDNIKIETLVAQHGKHIVNTLCNDDESPLTFAAREGHVPTIKLLIDLGAIVDQQDSTKKTPLYEATRHHHPEAVNTLLTYGKTDASKANPNVKDIHDATPLHEALKHDVYQEIAITLHNHGANLYARDDDGRTPLDIAENPTFAYSLLPCSQEEKSIEITSNITSISKNDAIFLSLDSLIKVTSKGIELDGTISHQNACEIVTPTLITSTKISNMQAIHNVVSLSESSASAKYIMNHVLIKCDKSNLCQLDFTNTKLACDYITDTNQFAQESNSGENTHKTPESCLMIQELSSGYTFSPPGQAGTHLKTVHNTLIEKGQDHSEYLLHNIDVTCDTDGLCDFEFGHAILDCSEGVA